jgi:hypothetical protein
MQKTNGGNDKATSTNRLHIQTPLCSTISTGGLNPHAGVGTWMASLAPKTLATMKNKRQSKDMHPNEHANKTTILNTARKNPSNTCGQNPKTRDQKIRMPRDIIITSPGRENRAPFSHNNLASVNEAAMFPEDRMPALIPTSLPTPTSTPISPNSNNNRSREDQQ